MIPCYIKFNHSLISVKPEQKGFITLNHFFTSFIALDHRFIENQIQLQENTNMRNTPVHAGIWVFVNFKLLKLNHSFVNRSV